jgi:hypothetical protein
MKYAARAAGRQRIVPTPEAAGRRSRRPRRFADTPVAGLRELDLAGPSRMTIAVLPRLTVAPLTVPALDAPAGVAKLVMRIFRSYQAQSF